MNYIEKLYQFKKIAVDKIMDREKTGFYMINGYNYKFDDIAQLEKITDMIDKWNSSNRMVWNNISQNMNEYDIIETSNDKKLSFKKFVEKVKVEESLISFNQKVRNNI